MTTNNTLTPLTGGRKLVLGLVALGLVAMLGASMMYRAQNPSITKQGRAPQATKMQDAMNGDAQMDELAQLMAQMKEEPSNPEVLLALADRFMKQQDWKQAETFLKRAAVSAPADGRVLYMLGISQFNQDNHTEAAKTFEALIKVDDDPSARFNLGVIYVHYLNDAEKGRKHYQAIIDDPKADDDLKARATKELERKAHGQ